ncbi:TolC family protein [Flavobacterium sp. B17]|uniref:TolC family protein n=1 Tax=Flavobacterium sp. B17 TaxID=95618 RepID=UPI0005B251C2|nr:TolC family protein [Flavobacterium sp. B17]
MKKPLLILFVLLSCVSVKSQVVFSSFQEVRDYADQHSVSIRISEAQQEVNAIREKQSRSFLYPSVNASAGFNDNITLQPTLVPAKLFNPNAPEGSFEEMTFGKTYLYTTSIQAQWNVLDFQKIFAIKTSEFQSEAGKLNTEINRFNTYNQLASVYYSILLAQKSLEIDEKNANVTKRMLSNASEKYQKGIISESDLNRVSIQHLQNEKKIKTTESNLDQLYRQLQSILNLREEIQISDLGTDEDHIINPDFQAVHPEILFQEKQIDISKSLLKQSEAMRYPTLGLVYQYNHNWATDHFMDFSNVNNLPQQFFGVKLNLPLFNGFSINQKIKESQTELKIQQMQLENTKIVKDKEDEILKIQYDQSIADLEKTTEILQLQEQNDIHTQNKYESGIISLDERLDRYSDLLSAQYDYLRSLSDFSLAKYKIYLRTIDFHKP